MAPGRHSHRRRPLGSLHPTCTVMARAKSSRWPAQTLSATPATGLPMSFQPRLMACMVAVQPAAKGSGGGSRWAAARVGGGGEGGSWRWLGMQAAIGAARLLHADAGPRWATSSPRRALVPEPHCSRLVRR